MNWCGVSVYFIISFASVLRGLVLVQFNEIMLLNITI